MVPYGTGTVSADGLQIVPDLDPANPGKRFGLVHFDWHGPQPPPDPDDPSPDPNPPLCGDPVDLSSCIMVVRQTDLSINGARGSIGIERNYRSLSTIQGPFGIGTNHNYGYRLDTVSPQTSTVITLIMPQDNKFPFVRQPDNTFINETVPVVRGAVMTVPANGQVDLRWKNGTIFHFGAANVQLGSLLVSSTDRNGNQITLVRSQSRPIQILKVIDPVGRKLTLNYDGVDRITSIIDPIGRTVQYSYNGQGTLETVTNPEGGVTRYDYDFQNRMTQITDPRGIVVAQNTYDTIGRVIKQIQADGGVLTFDYELLNPLVPQSPVQKTTVTDPLGNQFSYRFNPQGHVRSRTNALGQTTDFEIESGTNLPVSTTDPLGRTRSYTYDAMGNRTSITDPDGNITTIEYDPIYNFPTKITDAVGQATELTYDAQGNLVEFNNPLNEKIRLTYNGFGQTTSVTDPLGNTRTFAYNLQGDRIATTDPLGNQNQRDYDSVSRRIERTDPRGFVTQYTYDRKGRVTQITNARGGVTQFIYDLNDNLLSFTDANGQSTSLTYDTRNRLVSRTDGLGRQESYAYDFNNNKIQFIDRKNQMSTATYDPLNRRSSVTYNDGSTTTFTYDAVSRLTRITDSGSGTIRLTYDNLSRLIQETTPQGSLEYTYDALGRRETMASNGQVPVNYDYDGASRLTQVSQGLQIVDIGYDPAGRRTSLTYPNGTSTTYTYDDASRLINLVHQGPTGVFENLTYTFNAAGHRVSLNRLNKVASDPPASIQAAYDAANEQIQFNSATPNLTYDANGNLEARVIGPDTTTYTWDARNHLVAIDGVGYSANFAYDAVGRRVSKAVNGNMTSYHYDGVNIVEEMKNGTTAVRFLNSLTRDERFIRQSTSNEYYHVDVLSSTLALTDDTGTVQTSYRYDPYGSTNIMGQSPNTFTYTGREFDSESGLYYYRARYYDPITGLFLSEDPIGFAGRDVNLYRYVRNNPVNGTDSLGLWPTLMPGEDVAEQKGPDIADYYLPDLTDEQTQDLVDEVIDELDWIDVGDFATEFPEDFKLPPPNKVKDLTEGQKDAIKDFLDDLDLPDEVKDQIEDLLDPPEDKDTSNFCPLM